MTCCLGNPGKVLIISFFNASMLRYKYSASICSMLKDVLSLNKTILLIPETRANIIKSASNP